jgi:hypothetical protein
VVPASLPELPVEFTNLILKLEFFSAPILGSLYSGDRYLVSVLVRDPASANDLGHSSCKSSLLYDWSVKNFIEGKGSYGSLLSGRWRQAFLSLHFRGHFLQYTESTRYASESIYEC